MDMSSSSKPSEVSKCRVSPCGLRRTWTSRLWIWSWYDVRYMFFALSRNLGKRRSGLWTSLAFVACAIYNRHVSLTSDESKTSATRRNPRAGRGVPLVLRVHVPRGHRVHVLVEGPPHRGAPWTARGEGCWRRREAADFQLLALSRSSRTKQSEACPKELVDGIQLQIENTTFQYVKNRITLSGR